MRLSASSTPVAPGAWSAHTLAVLASGWIATVCNLPLWQALAALPEMQSARGLAFGAGFALIIGGVTALLLSLLAWPRLIKATISLFLISAAFGAYFMLTYGVVIDPTMMRNVVQTDVREVRDLLSLRLLIIVLLMAGLPLWWLWRRPLRRLGALPQLGRNLLLGIGGLLLALATLALSFADMSSTMRNHKSLRYLINPLNSYYALGALAHEAQAKPQGPPLAVGAGATLAARAGKPPLMLLVVGETARAANFSLNGYERPTNPELQKLGVVSFTNVSSCGTNTAASVPCMFSFLGREPFVSRDRDHENLLDLIDHMGMAVLWLDNQAGCKGVCDRVPHAGTASPAPGGPALPAGMCRDDGECFDVALLHGLEQRLAALPAEKRARGVLLVLHQMGSHGPAYHLRSPPDRKPFLPECTTNVLQQCERQSVVNAYDNTIAYTDHVLANAARWLEGQAAAYDPALLYFSDHGESLGENNLYLHGLPYSLAPREQTHIPMIAWWPAQTSLGRALPLECVARQRDAELSHDNLFHTVVGWFGIDTPEYKASLDAFRSCRGAAP